MSNIDSDERKGGKAKMPFLLLRILALILCFIIGVGAYALIRGQMLVSRIYRIPWDLADNSRIMGQDDEMSLKKGAEDPGVRIIGLADLHGNMIGKNQVRLVREVQAENPDIIVLLGDMVDRTKPEESVDSVVILVKELTTIAPVYYVNGNHEDDIHDLTPDLYKRMNDELTVAGAVHLENELTQVQVGEVTVNICGIYTHYYWSAVEHGLINELRTMDGVNVVICHYPEAVVWNGVMNGGQVDVALCGHTHGGLINIPFIGGMYAPEQGWWPRYYQGAYPIYTDTTWREYGGAAGSKYLGTIIVSAGLAGEHGVPRLNNPMEVSVMEIWDKDN